MKVLMISKTFLKGHPKAGKPTDFNCKIQNALMELPFAEKKLHTIRVGSRFKKGDRVSLRQWSGKPYRSKQIEIAELTIKEVFDMHFNKTIVDGKKVLHFSIWYPVGDTMIYERAFQIDGQFYEMSYFLRKLANNDGLSGRDFVNWFESYDDFIGQIICWVDPKY